MDIEVIFKESKKKSSSLNETYTFQPDMWRDKKEQPIDHDQTINRVEEEVRLTKISPIEMKVILFTKYTELNILIPG